MKCSNAVNDFEGSIEEMYAMLVICKHYFQAMLNLPSDMRAAWDEDEFKQTVLRDINNALDRADGLFEVVQLKPRNAGMRK